ncbi:MAG TPA: NAD(P)-binding protein [Thermoanaerobaculia bacterium]|nr:NAD(P)-binding protein [Thermoanaerobaculia bacterium]
MKPIRVAVVGGGCAAMTAAFELTRPEHLGRYQVTVYQQGWRLGGKGASGRGAADRVEEHGLHVWMGFYENAFRVMRECYAELGRNPARCRVATWRDAFFPAADVGVMEGGGDGSWQAWTASFPPMPGLPGDPFTEENPFTVSGYLGRAVQLVLTLLESARARQGGAATGPAAAAPSWRGLPSPEAILAGLGRLARLGGLATAAGLAEGARGLQALFDLWGRVPPARGAEGPLDFLVEAFAGSVRRLLAGWAETDEEVRRLWTIADLLLTVVRGSVRFGLVTDPRGFDAIDGYDYREWLEINGAARATIDSAFVRGGGYNLSFSYEGGDLARPRTSAGQALRGALRMFFTYRGAFFWKMRAGMGDIVFAPLYEVLQRRGVRFEFFHRLENVRLAEAAGLAPGERPYVEALEFDVQARVRGGVYQPLIDVHGLPCWPARPDYGQLEDSERLEREGWDFESFWDLRKVETKTLRVVEDFDFVVLGVGVGAIPHVCREIVARDPRWRRMVERVQSVETQAFQVWMSPGVAELGWRGPEGVTVSGFVEPFDTWADMAHLLPEEGWPAEGAPRSLAYFCSVLPSPAGPAPDRSRASYPAERREEVRAAAVRFLESEVRHLWPAAAATEGGFRWDLLVDAADSHQEGAERFASQFWTANVNPSDRYTLSLPGTARDRISPLDNSYDNLTITGDWTSCGLIAGCVEAAVMSGRLAAHAICRSPALAQIVGFDHP